MEWHCLLFSQPVLINTTNVWRFLEGDKDVPDVPCGVLSQYALLIASCLYFGVNVGMCMCYLWLCRQPPESLHGGRLTLCRAGCGFWDTDSTYL